MTISGQRDERPTRRHRVVTIDLDHEVGDVAISGFDGVTAIVTRGGRPIDRLSLKLAHPGSDGVLRGQVISDHIRASLWKELWVREFADRLRSRLESNGSEGWPHLTTTVVICTRDRPDHIAHCLVAVAHLDPKPDCVLVVDNAPTKPCREAVERYGFDYVVEGRPGLDNARNRAIELCSTELIAFTDDDCRPLPTWLAGLDKRFADLATGAVTGWGAAARLDSDAQLAFERLGGFSRGNRTRWFDTASINPAAAGQTGAGANMTFRTDVLRALGGFPPELDAGTATASGGDIYVLGRVLAAGMRVVYDPSSMVWHDHRADTSELRRVMRGYGRGITSMASRALLVDGELPALKTIRWPFTHFVRTLTATLRSQRGALELLAAAEQARGAVEGPLTWARSLRRAGPRQPLAHARAVTDGGTASSRVVRYGERALSVIVPTTGTRPALLGRCLAALQTQTLARECFEIIVVPNGPRAHDIGPIAGADRVVPVHAAGAAGARNAGVREASGDNVLFLDDDIVAQPRCLEAHLSRQKQQPAAVLGPAYPLREPHGLAAQASTRWWLDHYSRKHRPGHRFSFVDFLTGNVSLPRRIFADVGGFDETFDPHRREDWEFGYRLLAAGVPLVAETDAVANHHHARSLTAMLRDARREGYGDVLLASRHPGARRDLDLADVTHDKLGSPIWRAAVAIGRTATGPGARATEIAMASLEMTGRCTRWTARFGRLIDASYRAGVQDALDDAHELPDGPFAQTIVDLDSDDPIESGPAFGEITFRINGHDIGHVAAPGGQWDVDAIIEGAVDSLALPALATLAKRADR